LFDGDEAAEELAGVAAGVVGVGEKDGHSSGSLHDDKIEVSKA
jgi:hypothetical protein